ncbi:MAG TPA: hypothetical protein VFI65_29255, partial [Streptosporangiaceae bacterium]|nr:hypothetical protein [Streptosporangiaceae bacterium]
GDNQVLPITWSDNDITLWPGESQTLTATYHASLLGTATPVVSVSGWNVANQVAVAAQSRAAQNAVEAAASAHAVQHFGVADGVPGDRGSAEPGHGAAPGSAIAPAKAGVTVRSLRLGHTTATSHASGSGPAWSITSVADSSGTTPSTSFTQGDDADTYTITVTNSGKTASDGSTAVTFTDVVDPNISLVSISGDGWTCDTSNDPTETCTETGGTGGGPAVLAPGQSYPPITLTVQVPLSAGFGTQDSTDGLHVTNAVTVTGGAPSGPTASLASATPIAGVPSLTADNAIDGAFRQGDSGDQYQITVINTGGGPTSGSSSSPVTATITGLPTGETIQALYGSGWTCSLTAITAPVTEPANTCYRTDVLPGENGEEPPITVVVSVANNAPATGNETVLVGGGGDASSPASVATATTILQAADLTAASSHSGDFAQGDQADSYTLTVANVTGPNSTTGGPSSGLVTLADSLPWGLSATAMSGPGWTCNLAALTCYRGDALAAGSSYPPVTLTVSVAANAPATVTNSVTVSGGGMTAGPNSSTSNGGQTGTDPTTVTPSAGGSGGSSPRASSSGPAGTPPAPPAPPVLSITSSHDGAFAQGDVADPYSLTVSNGAGAGPTSGMVVVTDALPAGLTPTRMSGTGWTCSLAPATLPPTTAARRSSVLNTYEPQPTCYRFDSVAAGQEYPPITLDVAVANNSQPAVSNSVSVSGGGNAGVAAGTDPTNVAQLAQLSVTSFDSAAGIPYAPFIAGAAGQDTYHLTVANDGFGPTSGQVTVRTDLAPGLTAVSESGPGWTCHVATATCSTNPGVTLAAGAQSQITLTVTVTAGAPMSAQTLIQASGGGAISAAEIDETNHYNIVATGGVYVDPTYLNP